MDNFKIEVDFLRRQNSELRDAVINSQTQKYTEKSTEQLYPLGQTFSPGSEQKFQKQIWAQAKNKHQSSMSSMDVQKNLPPIKPLYNSKSDASLIHNARNPEECDFSSNYTLKKINPQGTNLIPKSRYSSSQSSLKPKVILDSLQDTEDQEIYQNSSLAIKTLLLQVVNSVKSQLQQFSTQFNQRL